MEGETRGLMPTADTEKTEEEARVVAGSRLPSCTVASGLEVLAVEAGRAIANDPALAGRTVLTADIINPVWLIAGAPMQSGAQLWRYAPLGPMLDELDLLAAPHCPAAMPVRNAIIDEIEEAGVTLKVALETPNWTVFEKAY